MIEDMLEPIFGELKKIYSCSNQMRYKVLINVKKVTETVKSKVSCSTSSNNDLDDIVSEYSKQLIEDIDTVIKNGIIQDEFIDIADCYLYGYDQIIEDIKN